MTQRISIQYSIDIDDLEGEVNRLLQKSFGELGRLSDTNFPNSLSLETVESIDSVRQRLAAIDVTLQDITSIVGGYINFKTSQVAVQNEKHLQDVQETNYEVTAEPEYSF